jgi:hypothetical protein
MTASVVDAEDTAPKAVALEAPVAPFRVKAHENRRLP